MSYHQTQSICWRTENLGIQAAYKDDENIKKFIEKYIALAFVPTKANKEHSNVHLEVD